MSHKICRIRSSFGFRQRPMAEAIKEQNFRFDAIYTGYLANGEQAEIISDIITLLADEDTRIIVDPAMADGGAL